jgi:hypothetical protein
MQSLLNPLSFLFIIGFGFVVAGIPLNDDPILIGYTNTYGASGCITVPDFYLLFNVTREKQSISDW